MDLMGRFPYRSSRGNGYILVGYHYDRNSILVGPMQNREAQTITTAWEHLNTKFGASGSEPKTYIMDNQCPGELKQAFTKHIITW